MLGGQLSLENLNLVPCLLSHSPGILTQLFLSFRVKPQTEVIHGLSVPITASNSSKDSFPSINWWDISAH